MMAMWRFFCNFATFFNFAFFDYGREYGYAGGFWSCAGHHKEYNKGCGRWWRWL